jgi:hypothetical protein
MEKVCHDLAVALDEVVTISWKYWWPSDVDGRDKPGHDVYGALISRGLLSDRR